MRTGLLLLLVLQSLLLFNTVQAETGLVGTQQPLACVGFQDDNKPPASTQDGLEDCHTTTALVVHPPHRPVQRPISYSLPTLAIAWRGKVIRAPPQV